jgi:hypothetical protein
MTEADWLASDDPSALLSFLGDKASARKVRLFAVACCRRVRHLLTDPRSVEALEVGERYAEKGGKPGDLSAAERGADSAQFAIWGQQPRRQPVWGASLWAKLCVIRSRIPGYHNVNVAPLAAAVSAADRVAVLRDLFGNPFRPADLGLAWRSPIVLGLARAVYDGGRFDDRQALGVLADALEDAGCDHAELLSHLRGPGPHVRGCWALDVLLGKS